ncbi:MAG: two-component system response regulator LytT [Flavobacterium sp.]|jgi:two-component system response regulator LytT
MEVVIIEDEIPAGKRLEKLVTEKGFVVLTILKSVKEAKIWFKSNEQPDLVFMDIKLRDDLCFVLFDSIDFKCQIVFTTAYDEFALKAFDYNSLDYLLKPIDTIKLDKLLLKINTIKATFYPKNYWKNVESSFHKNYKTSFLITIGANLKKIESENIVLFFSENNSSFILDNSERIYSINFSLDSLEEKINPDYFFRISRKHIIQKKFISHIEDFHIVLKTVKPIRNLKISYSKLKPFIEFYKN